MSELIRFDPVGTIEGFEESEYGKYVFADEAQSQVSALREELATAQALSVTNIMVDVVPGEDGMGEEIYAKSVADLQLMISNLYLEAEDQEQRLADAERRNSELVVLLSKAKLAVDDIAENCEDQEDWSTANSMHALSERIDAALNPNPEAASHDE